MRGPITPSLSERVTPFRVLVGVVLVVVVTLVIFLRPAGKFPGGSGQYLLIPDIAHPVAPLVKVEGGKAANGRGQLFFVDVQEQQASELDVLVPWFRPAHSTLLPERAIIPPGATQQQVTRSDLRQMATSKQVAAAVAERELGYDVVAEPNGVLVDYVDPHTNAIGKLQLGDVIDSVSGQQVMTLGALHTLLGRLQPGDVVVLGIRRGSKQQTVRVKTIANRGRAEVGILVEQTSRVVLPKKVAIDSGDIGGPSAGLAFALEVMQKLGRDVTNGYKVAATGEMNLDGKVTAIGGVEQKTWGAREAGAQVFLVPVDGRNARDAEKYAGPNLKIIPVTSLKQALSALAALPKLP